MNRSRIPVLALGALCVLGSLSFAASTVQGWMTADGVTGRPASRPHKWDREIVYLGGAGEGGVTAGMRMLAYEKGWFFIQPPGGFPGGRYIPFTINMANIDGGSVGFDHVDAVSIPAGSTAVENLQFRTHAHYSVMYDADYTEWTAEPWVWGSDFYQTFVATGPSVTRVATKLAGKNGDHYSMTLNYAIYKTTAGPPSTWTRISPIRTRFLPGTMDPIIHILDVNFLSSEAPTTPGEEYAIRYWLGAGSQSTAFAIVARPEDGSGFAAGQAWSGDSSLPGWDLYGYVTGGAPETITTFCPLNHEEPMDNVLLGWQNKQGQTFVASGLGLAAVELMYTVGCAPNPSLPVTVTVYNGFGGAKIGTSKMSYTVTDECQGRVAAFWEAGEVPLEAGRTYYVEFDATAGGGINVWGMKGDMPGVNAYVGGVSKAPTDLPMMIAEYSGGDIPTPLPTSTPDLRPTPTMTPTPDIGENILPNGDMEQGSTGTTGHTPYLWTTWTGTGNPTYWFLDYGRDGSLAPRLIGGAINGKTFDAGLYQQVTGLTAGERYGLTGWVSVVPMLNDVYEAWIGYDLTGQTSNGLAGTVQYTKTGGSGMYAQMPVREFEATGGSVSIWLRARTTSTADVYYSDFDDVVLWAIEDPTPTPGPSASSMQAR